MHFWGHLCFLFWGGDKLLCMILHYFALSCFCQRNLSNSWQEQTGKPKYWDTCTSKKSCLSTYKVKNDILCVSLFLPITSRWQSDMTDMTNWWPDLWLTLIRYVMHIQKYSHYISILGGVRCCTYFTYLGGVGVQNLGEHDHTWMLLKVE